MSNERVANRADAGIEQDGALERVSRRVDSLESALEHVGALDVEPRGERRLGLVRVGHVHEVRRERLPLAARRAGAQGAGQELGFEALQCARVAGRVRERLLPGHHGVRSAVAERLEEARLGRQELGLVQLGGGRRELVLQMRDHRRQRRAGVHHAAQDRVRRGRARVDLERRLGVGRRAVLVSEDGLAGDRQLDPDAREADLVPGRLESDQSAVQEVEECPRVRHVRLHVPHGRGLGAPRAASGQRRRALARRLRRRLDLGQVDGGQVGRGLLQRQHLRFDIPALVGVAHQAVDRRDVVAVAFHLDVVDHVQRDRVQLDGLGRHSGGSLPDGRPQSFRRTRRAFPVRLPPPATAGPRRPRRPGRGVRPGPSPRRNIASDCRFRSRRAFSCRTSRPSS